MSLGFGKKGSEAVVEKEPEADIIKEIEEVQKSKAVVDSDDTMPMGKRVADGALYPWKPWMEEDKQKRFMKVSATIARKYVERNKTKPHVINRAYKKPCEFEDMNKVQLIRHGREVFEKNLSPKFNETELIEFIKKLEEKAKGNDS